MTQRRRPKVTALSRPGRPPASVRKASEPRFEVRFGIHGDKDPDKRCRQPGCNHKLRRGHHVTGMCGSCRNKLPPVLKVSFQTLTVAQRHARDLLHKVAHGDREVAAEIAGLSVANFDRLLAGEWPHPEAAASPA